MALTANTVWEVRSAGSDTNGGAFDATIANHGTDYSQQDAKNTVGNNISTADAVAAGTTTITSATASFTSAIVGNVIYLQGGSGSLTAVWRQVTAFTNSTTVTVDATVATGTGITMNIGGALASPGQCAASFVANNTMWIKAGTYTVSSTSSNVSGGIVAMTGGGAIQGYNASRGDDGTPPVLQVASSGVTSVTVFSQTATNSVVRNLTVDGQSKTSIKGFQLNVALGDLLTAQNCTNDGFGNQGRLMRCVATNVTGGSGGFNCGNVGMLFACVAYGNTVTGFYVNARMHLSRCLSYGNSNTTSHGFNVISGPSELINCVAYNNGGAGVRLQYAGAVFAAAVFNTIAESNGTGYGFDSGGATSAAPRWANLVDCAGYSNNLGNVDPALSGYNLNFQAGSSSFFVSASGNNFALNATASAGTLARSAGFPGAFPAGSSTGYLDIGAVQSPPMAPLARAFTGF